MDRLFSCTCVQSRAPRAGMGEVARNKGWRQVVFSSHQLPLLAGKKGALCLGAAATPTKAGTGSVLQSPMSCTGAVWHKMVPAGPSQCYPHPHSSVQGAWPGSPRVGACGQGWGSITAWGCAPHTAPRAGQSTAGLAEGAAGPAAPNRAGLAASRAAMDLGPCCQARRCPQDTRLWRCPGSASLRWHQALLSQGSVVVCPAGSVTDP